MVSKSCLQAQDVCPWDEMFFEKFRVFCYQSGIRVLFATNRDKNTSIRFFLLTFFFILISYNEQ